jgi:DNA (cytosine-5)-methyltransferase 1
MDESRNLTLVSLFCGAGGLDIGLEQAGFETVCASDCDGDCIDTLRMNKERSLPVAGDLSRHYLASADIIREDIAELHGNELIPYSGEEGWRPDLLAGGPPCQPFSSSGAQRSVLDKRGRLFEHFVRLASVLRPRVILFENVRGLVTARGPNGSPGEVLQMVRGAFENIGYATRFELLNAADYGCPQRRVRLFMIATQDQELPEFPMPTHAEKPEHNLFGSTRPWVPLGDFLASREPPKSEEVVRPSATLGPLLAELPPGSGLKSPGRKEATRPGGHWGYKQGTFIADLTRPARTVTAASTQDWTRQDDGMLRRLTLAECAGLQGFPADWEFVGTKTSKFRQVGNAVPTVFGKVLGECIAHALQSPLPIRPPQSASLPGHMHSAMRYTRRDHERNHASRTRAKQFIGG